MAGSSAIAFIVALYDQLVTRLAGDPTFDEVLVTLAGEPDVSLKNEVLGLIRPGTKIEGGQEWAALGRKRRDETFTVPGRILTNVSGEKQDSAAFRTAALRAEAILGELVAEARDNHPEVADDTIEAHVAAFSYDVRMTESGWGIVLDFDLSVTVRV